MTASLRGILLCTALVMLLALLWTLAEAPRPLSPQVFALRPTEVREVRWLRAGQPDLVVQRRPSGWWVTAPLAEPAHGQIVEDILDVLAAARWQRNAEAARAGVVQQQLVVDNVAIGLGDVLGEQRWLLVRGRALLVDSWIAQVLDVDPRRLLDRSPFPDASRAVIVEIHATAAPWRSPDVVLGGNALVSPHRHRLDPSIAQRLRDQLAALVITPLAGSIAKAAEQRTDPPAWTIRVAGGPTGAGTLIGAGDCPGAPPSSLVVSSRLGAGCLDIATSRELAATVDLIVAPEALDLRPLATTAEQLADWTVLGEAGQPPLQMSGAAGGNVRYGESTLAVDPAAVAALVAKLVAPWPSMAIPPATARPKAAIRSTIRATHRDGSAVVLRIYRQRSAGGGDGQAWCVRDGEPFALQVPADLDLEVDALVRSFAEITLWQLEPTEVERMSWDDREVRRGAVVGEWLDAQGRVLSPAKADALEALVRALSTPRGRLGGKVPGRDRKRHVLALHLGTGPQRSAATQPVPSVGFEVRFVGSTCLALVDALEVELPPPLCR
jgi:hypothetical protein